MSVSRETLANPRAVKVVAAVVLGLSLGTLVPPEPVTLPAVGTVPGVAAGGIGLAVGAVLYLWVPGWLGASGCGCDGDCDCS